MLKIDMHVHSCCSDGIPRPEEIVKAAIRKGLDGVAITDHNTLKGSLRARKYVLKNKLDFLAITGMEIRTAKGDILAYGIEEEIEKGLSVEETLERIRRQGGIAVAAHPFSFVGRLGVGKELFENEFDAVEVINSRATPASNEESLAAAKKLDLPGTAGSDAHSLLELGSAYTIFHAKNHVENPVFLGEKTVLDLIKNKKISVEGKSTPMAKIVGVNIYKSAVRIYRVIGGLC